MQTSTRIITSSVIAACAVIDLHQIPVDAGLDRQVSETYGLQVHHHDLVFHGTCAVCGDKSQIS